jgi:hypothetical protein
MPRFISDIDLGQNKLLNAVFDIIGVTPSSGTVGQFYYNSNSNLPYYYDGDEWVSFSNIVSTDDIDEGITNLYFTEERSRNSISISPGSETYLNYSTASGEFSISALAITDVTVDNTATISATAYFDTNYTGDEFQEGDLIILVALEDGQESWIHNGGTNGTVLDFTKIQQPNLDDFYIRGLFSAQTPLLYDNNNGEFSIQQSTFNSDGYLSQTDWNTFNNKVDSVNGFTGSVILDLDDINDVVITAATNNDVLMYDNGNWLNKKTKKTWNWGGSANVNNATNRFLSKYDGTLTNLSPYISFYDAKIISMSIASNGAFTWTGDVYVNGVSVYSLSSGGNDSAFDDVIGITFSAGDKISLYVNGTNINRPSVEILIEEL